MLDKILTVLMILCMTLLIVNLIMDVIAHRWQIKRLRKEYEMLMKRIEDEFNGSDSKV